MYTATVVAVSRIYLLSVKVLYSGRYGLSQIMYVHLKNNSDKYGNLNLLPYGATKDNYFDNMHI